MEGHRVNLANAMKWAEKQIDLKDGLIGNIIANKTDWTNENIKLTIESNKNILDIDGWTKISEKKFLKIIKRRGRYRNWKLTKKSPKLWN